MKQLAFFGSGSDPAIGTKSHIVAAKANLESRRLPDSCVVFEHCLLA